jgi:hypothetical protein
MYVQIITPISQRAVTRTPTCSSAIASAAAENLKPLNFKPINARRSPYVKEPSPSNRRTDFRLVKRRLGRRTGGSERRALLCDKGRRSLTRRAMLCAPKLWTMFWHQMKGSSSDPASICMRGSEFLLPGFD